MVSVDVKGGVEDMAFFGLPQARDEAVSLNDAFDGDVDAFATDVAAEVTDTPIGPEPVAATEEKTEKRPAIVTSLLGKMTIRHTYQDGLVATGMNPMADTVFYGS